MPTSQKSRDADKKGVVYIGHMPQKFEEQEVVKYFNQFGRVKRVKVSRSIKTGQPKGYGYVQFHDEEVAQIAAETMNNYIMFRKSLKAHVVEPEKVHDELFKGCSRMLQPNKNQQRAVAQFNNASKKLAAVKKRARRRNAALKKLEKDGYELTLTQVEMSSQKEDKPSTPLVATKKDVENISNSKRKSKSDLPSAAADDHKLLAVKRKAKTPVTDSTSQKTKKVSRRVTLSTTTPTIIRDAATNDDSDDEITFKTPAVASDTTQVTGKASSKRKSTSKKVFPKTPVPGNKAKMAASPRDAMATPPSSLKKSGGKPEGVVIPDKVKQSDASPVLHARTVSKVAKTPQSARTSQRSIQAVAKTPPSKSQKISPRVTRSAAKKRKADM